MKKYLLCLVALLAVALVSCDKSSNPDARDAFVGSYTADALISYTVDTEEGQESGSMPVQGKVYITKNGDGNGVLIAGDVYCNGAVENETLRIEPQHFRQLTAMGLIDVNMSFEPAQLIDNKLAITGTVDGSIVVAGQTGTIDATITAVATKE